MRRAKTAQDVRPFRVRSYRAGGAAEALLSLPARFKATREAHGLSQRTVGERIGIGYAELSRFENGESNPTAGVLLRIALWIDDQPAPGIQAPLIAQEAANVVTMERPGRRRPLAVCSHGSIACPACDGVTDDPPTTRDLMAAIQASLDAAARGSQA